MEGVNDGILLVDKSEAQTSHDVVEKVRKILKPRKVGHAGTLDPFATGLLIILVGQGTKLSEFMMALPKSYEALIQLGVDTDTYDKTGKIVKQARQLSVTEEEVRSALEGLVGEFDQVPPPYSALKIKGQRAYQLARKGEDVKLAPRKVKIYEISVEQVSLPFVSMSLKCSSGTYVRSIAFDLGAKLGCGAHLRELRRTQIGDFRVEDAIRSSNLMELGRNEILNRIVNPVRALSSMVTIEIPDTLARKVRSGYCPNVRDVGIEGDSTLAPGMLLKLVCDEQLVAIASIKGSKKGPEEKILQLKRVFS